MVHCEKKLKHAISSLTWQAAVAAGAQTQNSGNDFELQKGFRVLVVEKPRDSITILFDRKTKPYSLDELPLYLAHKLALFGVPKTPRQVTAKAVYHSICPMSNENSRAEALTWLRELEDSAKGENPSKSPTPCVTFTASLTNASRRG